MISLYGFQEAASAQIVSRVSKSLMQPLEISASGVVKRIPFIQLLSSVTASGKTIILAQAVADISIRLPVAPLVLWLSKATVVVEQTYAELQVGGNLNGLMEGFEVRLLAEYDHQEISDNPKPFLMFATVGTFNQKDKAEGTRKIFRSAIDDAAKSTWESIKMRLHLDATRRPLIVVYDEAHNLSDQQTDLLLELDPDCLLLSTATQRLSQRIQDEIINPHKQFSGCSDEDITTIVDAKEVSQTGLIKARLELIGSQTNMETIIDNMHVALADATKLGRTHGLEGTPKAVYVCKTNLIEESNAKDDPKQPFDLRRAPPILIWRHLTEKLKVPPASIAVYCNLKMDKDYPAPEDFKIFSRGDNDYSEFVAGNYQHIIFNQSLQEGWDDPLLSFAYIDKTVGSRVQAEQIVGRLLRQPGRKHFSAERLNTAEIHIRVDSSGAFEEVVNAVDKKIQTGSLSIKLGQTTPGNSARASFEPKKNKMIPMAALVTDAAERPIKRAVSQLGDYRNSSEGDVVGAGSVVRVQKIIGGPGNESFAWQEEGHSSKVSVRWLFSREVRRIHSGALGMVETTNADGSDTKFDAMIGLGSAAMEQVEIIADKVAKEFIENVELHLRGPNPYEVGPLLQDPKSVIPFRNSVHKGYDNLNSLEMKFAKAVDRTGLTWCRNPSRSGYGIPIVKSGETTNFYPDFLVWKDTDVYAIDTKASFLMDDAMRKLVHIRQPEEGGPSLFIYFLVDALVDEERNRTDQSAFTVVSLTSDGKKQYVECQSIGEATQKCLVPNK